MSRAKDPSAGKRYRARQKAEREGKPVPKWAQVRKRNAPAPRRTTKAATPSGTLAAAVTGIVDGTPSAIVRGTLAGIPIDTSAAMPVASHQVAFDATRAATRKGSKALVSTANPAAPDAAPGAVAGAVRGALGHASSGPLAHAVAGALISGPVTAVGAGLMAANYSLVLGLATHLLGPGQGLFGWTLGESAAVGVVATEFVCGHVLTERLHEGRRDALTALVLAAVATVCLSEVLGSYVREVQATQAARVEAVHQAADLATKAAAVRPVTQVAQAAPVIQARAQEQMPEGLTPREQRNWRHDQQAKDRAYFELQEHLAAQSQAAQASQAKQAQEQAAATQKQQQKELGDALAMHSIFETPVLMLWALAMSVGAVIAAGAFGAFVRSLLAVPVAVVGLFRRSVAAQAPAAVPGAGKVEGEPEGAPAPAGGFLARLAHWPIVRMLTARRAAAGGATS